MNEPPPEASPIREGLFRGVQTQGIALSRTQAGGTRASQVQTRGRRGLIALAPDRTCRHNRGGSLDQHVGTRLRFTILHLAS
jgi:hypothetical protein